MRPSLVRFVIAAGLAGLAGCGSVQNNAADGGGGSVDAAVVVVDGGVLPDAAASIDAAPPLPLPPPGQELTGGAGRMTGTTYAMDVELGHALGQQPIASTTYRLQANTPIKP